MALRFLGCLLGLCSVCALAQNTFAVGGGTTAAVQATFVTAYQRGSFSALAPNAQGDVSNFGPSGLIQLFTATANKSQTYALVKPDSTSTANVVQMWAATYQFYGASSIATIGFPAADTAGCPPLVSSVAAGNSCVWQPFTLDTAMFVYGPNLSGANLAADVLVYAQDPFYTVWNNLGGIPVLGPAIAQITQVSSQYGSGAIIQQFDQGTVYSFFNGPVTGQAIGVKAPIFNAYQANGGETGVMGLPLTVEQVLNNGMHVQEFERGAIEYNAATLVTALLPAVARVAVVPGGPVQMYLEESLPAQGALSAADGTALNNRLLTWASSNPAVVKVVGSGPAVSLVALTYGTAMVTAAAEGQASAPLVIAVTQSYCCQIGQGAPTSAVQQAFKDAVARDGLSVTAASGVTRVGNGYVQTLVSTATPAATYLLTVADSSGAAYVVGGAILTAYQQLGGPASAVGYPLGDANAAGRQLFQGGALAGSPVELVTGTILTEWQALGYEAGLAGAPVSAASTFLTFRGTVGAVQSFANGEILATSQGFLVGGPVLATYNAGGGPGGNLGAPTGPQFVSNGVTQQNFEGGNITYAGGAASAVEHDSPRQPLITATPGQVRAGSSVHLVIGGFNNGATVKVTQTGQAAFLVTAPSGSYAFDTLVPGSAAAGTVTVTASDTGSSASATATYTVYTLSPGLMTIAMVSGNLQTGAPGGVLPQPLVVVVNDQNGNPVAGQSVAFTASPGAVATPTSAVTGANGTASAQVQMPANASIALVTAAVAAHFVTFSEQSAAYSVGNFPALSQAVSGTLGNGSDTIQSKGALLTSVAGILSYYQALGKLPQPNGLATPVALNQFLKTLCNTGADGSSICDGFTLLGTSNEQTVNLWRVGAFVGGNLTVRIVAASAANVSGIQGLAAAGTPVVVALSLGSLGSHFVVAMGVNADGSLMIADPNPAFAQTNLNAYLNGFTAGGQSIQGTVTGAVALLPQAPATPGFMVASSAAVMLTSAAGSCGPTLQFPGVAAVAGAMPASAPGTLVFGACGGAGGLYELDAGAGAYNLTFTDLGAGGERTFASGPPTVSYEAVSNGQNWTLTPLSTLISGSVVNAASYTTAIAPGGLISIFGAGLSGAVVQIDGQSAKVVAATPFQVNAQVPAGTAVGAASLTVSSAAGSATQQFNVSSVAPAIFVVGTNQAGASQAAITNLDNSLNTPSNPALRGSYLILYVTGLGATAANGAAAAAVSVVINGIAVTPAYAGVSGGGMGLYQVNVQLPATMAPGLELPLYLKQGGALSNGGAASNTVMVAVQ